MTPAHRLPLQVRLADTDALGHINNAAYATYGEAARLAFLGTLSPGATTTPPLGLPLVDPDDPGVGLILAHLAIDFRRQAHFGQTLYIDTAVTATGRTSFTLRHEVVADGQVAAEMRAVLVVFDYRAHESRPLPARLRAALDAAAAG